MSKESELRIVSLISGGGSTMEAIVKATYEGELAGKVKVVAVIADRPEARGIFKATSLGVRQVIGIDKTICCTWMAMESAILNVCRDVGADVILQNGWLSYTPEGVIEKYEGRIFNQHPAGLDPHNKDKNGEPLHFGGKGMHGLAAHAAVLKFQELTGRDFPTEATIHHVTAKYDEGQVVYRAEVSVHQGDTPEILAARVLPVEHQGQINFLNALYEGAVQTLRRSEILVRVGEEDRLYESKEYGISKYNKKQ